MILNSPTLPSRWLLLALAGFLFLPVRALDYGIWEAKGSEIFAAMGWAEWNLSQLWFGALALLALPRFQAGSAQLYLLWAFALFVLISAKLTEFRFGYAMLPFGAVWIALLGDTLARRHQLQGDRFWLCALIAIVLALLFFVLYPIAMILLAMFEGGIAAFWAQFAKPYLAPIIRNSLTVAATVGILSTFLGLCFALYTTRIARKSAVIGKLFSILPIVTPPFVVGLGVSLILGKSGYLTQLLVQLFDIPANWLQGFNGIVLAQTLALTPIAFMMLEGALKALPSTLEEAAYSLQAGQNQTFFTIILPLLKPAIANSFLVVSLQSLADFGTPLVLGGSFDVVATQIYFSIAGSQLDYPFASTLGTLLLLFSLAIFLVQYYWLGKRSYVTVAGKQARATLQPLPYWLRSTIHLFLALWVLFNAALYGSIFLGSFAQNWGIDTRFTLEHYVTLFGNGFNKGAWPSLLQTLLYATVAAPLTALLGFLLAYLIVRKNFTGRKSLEFITLLCFAVPGTVAGVAYLLAFNQAPIYLTGTAAIIVLSMVMRNMPIGMRAAVAGLQQIDKSLDEASLSLQASSWQMLRVIILPLLKPALLSALVTSFVRSMTTISALVFLVSPSTRVATSYILNRVEDGDYGLAVAYGSTLILVMLAVIGILGWILRDKHKFSRS